MFFRAPSFFLSLALSSSLALPEVVAAGATPVYQATGLKISEPTATSVTIWTRVTRDAARAAEDRPVPKLRVLDRQTGKEIPLKDNTMFPTGRPVIDYPAGADRSSIRGAAIGAPGQTQVRYRVAGSSAWTTTDWREVDPKLDSTALFSLTDLKPGTRYEIEVAARADANTAAAAVNTLTGGFVTSPAANAAASVAFCVMSCQKYELKDRPDGFAIYPAMQALRPDFFVNTGDIVYYDHGGVTALNTDLARYHWERMFSFPTLREFHQRVGSYFMKDDHDVLANDCEPGSRSGDLTFEEGLRIFREQTALTGEQYRTARWGRHLQIWMVEGRDFRTTRAPGDTSPPTIWGAPQIAWLERSLAASDASFRILITSTPIVGPDRAQKDDNYSNAGYAVEGARIRAMLGRHKNLSVITGDRHWQYVSTDAATGLEEWSVGAATDAHAGGWSEDTPRPQHRFLRTKHGGFLSGVIAVTPGGPTLTLRLHDTQGKVLFESAKTGAK